MLLRLTAHGSPVQDPAIAGLLGEADTTLDGFEVTFLVGNCVGRLVGNLVAFAFLRFACAAVTARTTSTTSTSIRSRLGVILPTVSWSNYSMSFLYKISRTRELVIERSTIRRPRDEIRGMRHNVCEYICTNNHIPSPRVKEGCVVSV